MVNNKKLLAVKQRVEKKATADKLKAARIQQNKKKEIAEEKGKWLPLLKRRQPMQHE